MDSFATAVSLALQYGVPLRDLVTKFSHLRFEPAGFTTNRDIPMAKSLVDYIFRYMASKFLSQDEKDQVGIINRQLTLAEAEVPKSELAAPDTTAGAVSAAASSLSSSPTSDSGKTPGVDAAASAPAPLGPGTVTASEDASAPAARPEAPSLLDGLKVIAQTSAKADASREERLNAGQAPVIFDTADSPACTECGSIMVRNGSCYKCINCGATSGCS
jgi:ribonucleoside-diphosphate reductase alpha chain